FHLESASLGVAGKLAHHRFHAADGFSPALGPICDRLHGKRFAIWPAVDEQIVARQPRLRLGGRPASAGSGEEEEDRKEGEYAGHASVLSIHESAPRKSFSRKGRVRSREFSPPMAEWRNPAG